MTKTENRWYLLVASLPTNGATARMRIWRALKALGCASLRDGAYLLPCRDDLRDRLRELCVETEREGGSAWLLQAIPDSAEDEDAWRTLFDRSEDYAGFIKAADETRKSLPHLAQPEITRALRKLRREYDAIRAIDYFPNAASTQAEAAWMDFVNAAEWLLSPGEPQAIEAAVPRRDLREYQGRTWATRRRMWVDRVASAWLIRRFIDRKARFLWLESPADCPRDALGFDFDGASFTHVGERVTFEVLLAAFGLEEDRGLARLGALVHVLDVGNGFVAEAAGFEAMLAGARGRAKDDDQLLSEMSMVLDSLYTHFSNANKENS
jgi:hypothetical protein